jgi:hypothetical protein
MFTKEVFSSQMKRLSDIFNYELDGEKAKTFYAELKKIGFDDELFSKAVDEIIANESAFPKIATFKKYFDKIFHSEQYNSKYGKMDCKYCNGKGRISYEKYEKFYDDYITITVLCVCSRLNRELDNRYRHKDIATIGLKDKIDKGEYLKDFDGTYKLHKKISG